jgi:hypothetical protein
LRPRIRDIGQVIAALDEALWKQRNYLHLLSKAAGSMPLPTAIAADEALAAAPN